MTAMHYQALDTIGVTGLRPAAIRPAAPAGRERPLRTRCRVTVARNPVDPIGRPLAFSVASAVVFLIADTTPLMGLSAVGREASTTILGGAQEMWTRALEITTVIVAFCAVIAPGAFIAFMLAVLIGAKRTPAPRWVGQLSHGRRWSSPGR